MKYEKINGLEKNISKLIIGNDNQTDQNKAFKLWDHWINVGGNAFDNAHIYGGGSMETLLGKWHKSRNNLKDLIIIAKGAHTPNCNPESISSQLTESLDRLQCESADFPGPSFSRVRAALGWRDSPLGRPSTDDPSKVIYLAIQVQ